MTDPPSESRYVERRAGAELLGSIGAGVLGAGLALLFREWLGMLAVPLLVVGGIVHGLAMYEKHRLDASTGNSLPVWAQWTYWLCWVLLVALVVYVWLEHG